MAYTEKELIETKKRLSTLREAHKLSFKGLSEAISYSQNENIGASSLCEYESLVDAKTRLKRMNISSFIAIADYYEVTIEYLLGRTRSTKLNPDVGNYMSDEAIKNIEEMLNSDINDEDMDYRCDIPFNTHKYAYSRTNVNSAIIGSVTYKNIIDYLSVGFQMALELEGDNQSAKYYFKTKEDYEKYIEHLQYEFNPEFFSSDFTQNRKIDLCINEAIRLFSNLLYSIRDDILSETLKDSQTDIDDIDKKWRDLIKEK